MILINRKDLPEANAVCKTCGRKYRLCKRCLKLRSMGLESWREYCDCVECYQVYTVLSKDINDITKEEFDYIVGIELPEGQEYTKEVKNKFNEVKKHFDIKNNSQVIPQVDNNKPLNKDSKTTEYKKFEYSFGKKKNNKSLNNVK